MGAEMADDALDAVLAEFVQGLSSYDLGLWELTWMAANRSGVVASSHVSWARASISDLVARGVVHLAVTSWPSMTPERELAPPDWRALAASDAPWHDPQQASILVLVQIVAAPASVE